MTNEEILAHVTNAVKLLKSTTVAYPTWLKNFNAGRYPNGSSWGSAFDELKKVTDALTVVTPPSTARTYGSGSYGSGSYGA